MKGFKFRLATVLKVREIETNQQAKILALAQQEAIRIRDEILELQSNMASELKRIQDLSHRGLFDQQILDLSIPFRERLKMEIKRKTDELQMALKRIDLEREKLIERQKKKKALEKLEEKHRENYVEENRKSESKVMDELASARWAHIKPR